ncbi:peptide synthetase, variant 2 [Coprinopsis cinerea AmutBmut pab1-1]|nr:peptide synthetase, variant 2 [Coprinopsis cinerea AmutBmut pab1-1]
MTTLDDLLLWRLLLSPDRRVFLRPRTNVANTKVDPITYRDLELHTFEGGDLNNQDNANDHTSDSGSKLIAPRSLVGLCLPSQYVFAVAVFALIRLGAVPVCLSPTNSDEVLEHLAKEAGVSAVISVNDTHGQLGDRLRRIPNGAMIINVESRDVSDLCISEYSPYPRLKYGSISGDDIAIVLHTSGSTSIPTLVPLSHRLLLRLPAGSTSRTDGFKVSKQPVVTTAGTPLFHILGVLNGIILPIYGGSIFAIPPQTLEDAQAGRTRPSARTLVDYAKTVGAKRLTVTPTMLMEIALLGSKSGVNLESGSEGMNFLRALNRVTVSATPMCQDHGDWIAEQGVHLVQVYGLTEGGCLLHSDRPRGDPNWQGMRPFPNVKYKMQPFGYIPGTSVPLYELVVKSAKKGGHFPGAFQETDEYHTRDLFQEWPIPGTGKYRFYGRKDEIILLLPGHSCLPSSE